MEEEGSRENEKLFEEEVNKEGKGKGKGSEVIEEVNRCF